MAMLTYGVEWLKRDDETEYVAYFGHNLKAAQAKARRMSDINDCIAYVIVTKETYHPGGSLLDTAEPVGEITYWGGLESGREGVIAERKAA